MANGVVTASIVEQFKQLIGNDFVVADEESLHKYGKDETENLLYLPAVVVKPKTAAEISAGVAGLSKARSLLTFATAMRTSDFWTVSVFFVAMGQSYGITSVVA